MKIYAIGDLHFGEKVDKPMDIFSTNWNNHTNKIKDNWKRTITDEDIVLIPGDISWGMTLEEAQADLDIINTLPGKKILIKGNHDYWWKSLKQISEKYPNMFFLQNNSLLVNHINICGAKGYLNPMENSLEGDDIKLYKRELIRLENSLIAAQNANVYPSIVMLHYPPALNNHSSTGFIDLIKKYNVKYVVYGHLHGEESHQLGIKDDVDGIHYCLVSADYLDFNLKLIVEEA